MKFFFLAEHDDRAAVERCFVEADTGRPGLAAERLGELGEELQRSPHVPYAEGMVRRDLLGQGHAAFGCFVRAHELAAPRPEKAETARLAAFNAAMLAPHPAAARTWIGVALGYSGGDPRDGPLLRGLLADLDRGVAYDALLRARTAHSFEAGAPGPDAATLEVALRFGGMDEPLALACRRDRALHLRELDRRAEQLRRAVGERFPPDERRTLIDALAELDVLLAADEYDATLWNYRSSWLGLLERHAEAVAAADRAIALRPHRYARPHVNRAFALYSLGRQAEASAAIAEALRHSRDQGSAEEIAQAAQLTIVYGAPRPTVPLPAFAAWVEHAVGQLAPPAFDRAPGGRGVVRMIVARFQTFARGPDRSAKTYVPLVDQLLTDYPPEAAFLAAQQVGRADAGLADLLGRAALYLAVHADGLRRGDAARLFALRMLSLAEDPAGLRRYYRRYVLEPTAAAAGAGVPAASGLDAAIRDQLGRMHADLPRLVADQEPVDAAGRERARTGILADFAGPPPPPIRERGPLPAAARATVGPAGCLAVLAVLGLGVFLWRAGPWSPRPTVDVGEVHRLLSHDAKPFDGLAWSPDGTRLATSSRRGDVHIWTVDGVRARHTKYVHGVLSFADRPTGLAWSPDGATLALTPKGRLTLWDVGADKSVLDKEVADAKDLRWSADGQYVVWAEGNGLRGAERSGADVAFAGAHTGPVNGLDRDPGGHFLTACEDGTWGRWDPDRRSLERTTGGGGSPLTAIRPSPNGDRVAAGGRDGTVQVWRTDGVPLALLSLARGLPGVDDLCWSADGTRVASAHGAGGVCVWDPHGGSLLARATGVMAYSVAWQPNANAVAVGGEAVVWLWYVGP